MIDDTSIIRSCQAGQLEKFGILYDKYIKKIYDFVYYKTNHRETAEDVCSLVFAKALQKISSFDPEAGTFQAWIYQIARNTVIDHYRTKKNEDNVDDYWSLSDNSDPARDVDIKNKLAEVDAYLEKLSAKQREIIILKLWQELSYKEITEIMGGTEAGNKMAFSRAIRKLRQEMPVEALACLLFFGIS